MGISSDFQGGLALAHILNGARSSKIMNHERLPEIGGNLSQPMILDDLSTSSFTLWLF